LSDRRRQRDAAVADIRVDGADEFVLDHLTVIEVTDAHGTANSSAPAWRRWRNLRRCQLPFEGGDARLQLGLLLKEVAESRVVGGVAVFAHLAKPLTDLAPTVGTQPREFILEQLAAPGRDERLLDRLRSCHVALLS
jgi:hypothetical protein